MWRQVVAQSPGKDAPAREILRYDVGWKALNTLLKSGRSLSGHERNCCFLNTAGGRFANISAATNMDFADDGRVLAVCDWDQDGDQDFWIANRTGPQVRFLRNDNRNRHDFVCFRLTGTSCNRDAIGARVELHLKDNPHPLRIQTLRAGEGYLAQCSKWLHFGLANDSKIEKAVVQWPDGSRELFESISPNQHYRLEQGTGVARVWRSPRRTLALQASQVTVPPSSEQTRVVLIAPVPIPAMQYESLVGEPREIIGATGRARVINLWATWCKPCLQELQEWSQAVDQLRQAGLDVIPINVDEPEHDRGTQKQTIQGLAKRLQWPFETGFATEELVVQFDVLQRSIIRRQRPLPIPTTFLIDGHGNLRIIYKGPVSTNQLLADARLLHASAETIVASGVPYEGKWLGQPAGTSPNTIAVRFVEGGFLRETERYILQLEREPHGNPMYNRAEALVLLGAIYVDQKRLPEAVEAFHRVLQIDPQHRQTHIELAGVYSQLEKFDKAAVHYRQALHRRPNDPELRFKLGVSLDKSGDTSAAVEELEKAKALRPTPGICHSLGNAYIRLGQLEQAIQQFRHAVELDNQFHPALNNLAWLLATSADITIRHGQDAVRVAEELCRQPENRTVGHLDTLAAAYAAAGQFDKAVMTLNEAVRKAKTAGDLQQSRQLEKRLVLYRHRKPYIE